VRNVDVDVVVDGDVDGDVNAHVLLSHRAPPSPLPPLLLFPSDLLIFLSSPLLSSAGRRARVGGVYSGEVTLPSRIRDYEVWGRLGEGGMSEVYLAKHAILGIPVIIKTLKPSISAGTTARNVEADRVINEARLMARIVNPRVVRAVDAGVHEGTAYLVQEYVDGIDLAELDRRRRASLGVGLPLWFVCSVMSEACEALHAAHQAGVVHRDVKPSNLFGAPETGARLGDFGIAVRNVEHAHEVSGTLRFMAPEQLRSGEVSRRTDAWGAAATACDLRYGKPPFEAYEDVLDPAKAPRMPAPRSPAEAFFQHLLLRMLAKDERERTPDVLEPSRQFGLLARTVEGEAHHAPFVFLDRHTFRIGDCTVSFAAFDIAAAKADAIVCSANYELKMRSGVAEALREKGGDVIEREAMKGGQQALGSCIATTAGTLSAKHVLHAVSAWNEASCVGRATQRALLLADELGVRSVAVPALGTGAARVTLETCASAMMAALKSHVRLGGTRLRQVQVVLADETKLAVFREVAEEALRDGDRRAGLDVGLPADERVADSKGATCLDVNEQSTR
jgi:O-acetyl-ADP-ribose deacetylase (regulator of RNase III)/tRNA A-37 threonylcarbamoyl transferase component Bud32